MARQRTDKIAFLICKEGATILDEFYAGICTWDHAGDEPK